MVPLEACHQIMQALCRNDDPEVSQALAEVSGTIYCTYLTPAQDRLGALTQLKPRFSTISNLVQPVIKDSLGYLGR